MDTDEKARREDGRVRMVEHAGLKNAGIYLTADDAD